jgi:hypothetical protein
MREVFADFMRLQDLSDGTRRIRLNAHRIREELLREGDQVMLIEYGQLRAPAVIHCVLENDAEHWYGVLTGPIEDLIETG